MSNYKNLSRRIWLQNSENKLGCNAIALYFFLLHEFERNKRKPFTLTDTEIHEQLYFHKRTMRVAREKLSELNLIHFVSRKGSKTTYSIPLYIVDEDNFDTMNKGGDKIFESSVIQNVAI